MQYQKLKNRKANVAQRCFKQSTLAMALGLALAGAAYAQPADTYWTGATSSDISLDSNWSVQSPFAPMIDPATGMPSLVPVPFVSWLNGPTTAVLSNPQQQLSMTGGGHWRTPSEFLIGTGASNQGSLQIKPLPPSPIPLPQPPSEILGFDAGYAETAANQKSVYPTPMLRVGDAGGNGSMVVDFTGQDTVQHFKLQMGKSGGLGVGIGGGSEGKVHVLGSGKLPEFAEDGLYLGHGKNFDAQMMSGGVGDSGFRQVQIGAAGGKGTLTTEKTSLYLGRGKDVAGGAPTNPDGTWGTPNKPEYVQSVIENGTLAIGSGQGSVGKLEVLNGGKLAQLLEAQTKFTGYEAVSFTRIGVKGGTGTLELSGLGADALTTPARATIYYGASLGLEGGHGNLNVLNGGKGWVHRENGEASGSSFPYCSATYYNDTRIAPLVISDGADGSTATARAEGKGSNLLVTGKLPQDRRSSGYNGPMQLTAGTIGRIQIAAGGALVAGNEGVVQVGAAEGGQKTATIPDPNGGPDRTTGYASVRNVVPNLGYVDAKGGKVYYGTDAAGGAATPGLIQASYIKTGTNASVVFNHNSPSFSFKLPVYGNGTLEQQGASGITFVSSALQLAAKPNTTQPAAGDQDTPYWDWITSGDPNGGECKADPEIYPGGEPTDRSTFTGKVLVTGGTLVLPEKDVLSAATAYTITNGVVHMASTDHQPLGAVEMGSAGTLNLSGAPLQETAAKAGTTPQATDVATATTWTGNGGTVALDTVLGDSSSASDKLVISGAITGVTKLQINNLGGAGAKTTGGLGILVVDAIDPSAAPGAFVLDGPVTAGSETYTLQRKGTSWYLVNEPAPVVPVITTVTDDVGASQGPVASGDTTDDTTPTLVGTGVPGSIVTIYSDGAAVGTATVDPQGNWTFTTAALPLGPHAFTATQKATADGAESAPTAPYNITIVPDTVPLPVAPAITAVQGDAGGTVTPVSNGGTTDDTTPTISGTGVPGNTVTVQNGTTVIGTATVGADGTWTITPTTPLAEATYTVAATQTNAGGAISPASSTFTFTVKLKVVGPVAATPVPANSVLGLGLLSALIAGASAFASRRRKRNG